MHPTTLAGIFVIWWLGLGASETTKQAPARDLVRLRRLGLVEIEGQQRIDLAAARAIPAFVRLGERIADFEDTAGRPMRTEDASHGTREARLVITAHLLSALTLHDAQAHPGAILGGREKTGRLLKEAQFQALMRCQSETELFIQAQRLALRLGGNRAIDIGALGAGLYLWLNAPAVQRDWARQYYWLDIFGFDGHSLPAQF